MYGWRLTIVRRTRSAADLRVSDGADYTNARHDHPEDKGAKKKSDDCACESINKLEKLGISLVGPLEQDHSAAGHERIDHDRKHGAA